MTDKEFERTRDFALRHLGYAPRSRKQLRDKLAQKGFLSEDIAATMKLLEQRGYVDDVAFAVSYISQKTAGNYGKRQVVAGLLQKGISKEDIAAAYRQISEDNETAEDETAACKRALAKRMRGKGAAGLSDPKEKQRIAGFLLRRGFGYDVIKKAMEQFAIEEEQNQ